MKRWANLKDVVSQPLEAFGEIVTRGNSIVLVFRDSFALIGAEWTAYGEIGDPPDAVEADPEPDVLDYIDSQMLIDLAIATPHEVLALIHDRDEKQAAIEAKRIQDGIAAEREQYERLRKKFGA